jgi:SAM-dependent methyltransferase
MTSKNIYTSGHYNKNNPTYHLEDSGFKWNNFKKLILKSNVDYKLFKNVAEVGCGVGQILSLAKKDNFFNASNFYGYDTNPDAIKTAKELDSTISFSNEDFLKKDSNKNFDLIIAADVIEHIEDSFTFLKLLRTKSEYFLFNIPLEISLLSLFRQNKLFESSYNRVGHLHFFSKKTALIALEHNGYKVLNLSYSKNRIKHFSKNSLSFKRVLAAAPQYLIDLISEDLSCILLGDYSLVVLATKEPKNKPLILNKFKKNYYSQNGEDGIILELIEKLNIKDDSWCCEFGAWDGINSSNTFYLVKEKKFNAVYIEPDESKYKELQKTKAKNSKIITINSSINKDKDSKESLDSILATTPIPKDFDILSIDIDSYDLEVWESLKNYLPKIVIIEINSSIKPGIYHRHNSSKQGNSFSSTIEVSKNKGYKLVCHTGNCIFVRNDLANRLNIEKKYYDSPELLFDNSWMNKKDSRLEKNIIKILPNFLINIIKKVKRSWNLLNLKS